MKQQQWLIWAVCSGALWLAAGCAAPSSGGGRGGVDEGNPYSGYCPVMGDALPARSRTDPKLYSDYKGKRYYLCCKSCKPKFDRNPRKWIRRPAAPEDE